MLEFNELKIYDHWYGENNQLQSGKSDSASSHHLVVDCFPRTGIPIKCVLFFLTTAAMFKYYKLNVILCFVFW